MKGAKRSVKMWTTNFNKSFSKNIWLYMSSRLLKIRWVHTYVMPRTVYFGWICTRGCEGEGYKGSSFWIRFRAWSRIGVVRAYFLMSLSVQPSSSTKPRTTKYLKMKAILQTWADLRLFCFNDCSKIRRSVKAQPSSSTKPRTTRQWNSLPFEDLA